MKDSTNMPNSGMGTDADCVTCHGDPAVCASAPGLRHCEKAMRHDAPYGQTCPTCGAPGYRGDDAIPSDIGSFRALKNATPQVPLSGESTGTNAPNTGKSETPAGSAPIEQVRASMREEAARACERAKVATERTQADVVHNRACDKCAEDIRAIRDGFLMSRDERSEQGGNDV